MTLDYFTVSSRNTLWKIERILAHFSAYWNFKMYLNINVQAFYSKYVKICSCDEKLKRMDTLAHAFCYQKS